jgi:hypothetical protein
MLRIVGKEYPLCILDTMAVSEMVKRPEQTFRHFLEWSHSAKPYQFVPCFTVYTLMEIRRKPELFAAFVEHFHPFPCVMLKGYLEFLTEEVASYPDPSRIDPCSLAFTPLGGEGNLLSNLPTILDQPSLLLQERQWNEAAPEIVSGMASLVDNYLPAGDTYTMQEVHLFVLMVSLSQLTLHGHAAFVERILAQDGEQVDMDAFPSLKSMTYTVFHKFYADRNRKPVDSDAFDVLIAATLPYAEAVITEAHLAEALRKTKRRDTFLDHLQVFTLRDFRDSPPT